MKLERKKVLERIIYERAAGYFILKRYANNEIKLYDTETKKLIQEKNNISRTKCLTEVHKKLCRSTVFKRRLAYLYIDFPSVNSRINTRQTDEPIYLCSWYRLLFALLTLNQRNVLRQTDAYVFSDGSVVGISIYT